MGANLFTGLEEATLLKLQPQLERALAAVRRPKLKRRMAMAIQVANSMGA